MGVFELPDNRYFAENVIDAAPAYEDVCAFGFPMVDPSFSPEGASVPGNMSSPPAICPHEEIPRHIRHHTVPEHMVLHPAAQRLRPDVHVRLNVQMTDNYPECDICLCVSSHPNQPHRCPAMESGLPRIDGASGFSAQTISSENHIDNACAQRLVFFDDFITDNADSDLEDVFTSEFCFRTDKGQPYECAVCACVLEFPLQEHCCPEQEWPVLDVFMFEHLRPLPGNNGFRMRM